MLSNFPDESRIKPLKRVSYRQLVAMLLTVFFLLWAVVRPLDVGHDTSLYVETFNDYFIEDASRFPDLIFNGIAVVISIFLNQFPSERDVGGRFFLVFIALIESALMVLILSRKKYVAESILLAISYGPLIFLDILRQGMSMLLAGVFLSGHKRKPVLMIGALSTHVVAIVALLVLPLKKINTLYYVFFIIILLILACFLSDSLLARYEYYSRVDGYFTSADLDKVGTSWAVLSLANIFVLMFFFYSAVVGGFTRTESLILSIFYIMSIFLPLLHRIYLFYFFSLSCSRDILINSKKLKFIIFDFLYAIVLLKFSTNAFFTFGGGD